MVATDGPDAPGGVTAGHGVTAGQVKSGVLWITGISLLRDGLQFGVMLALVRLLDARAYGEYALVNSAVALVTVFSFRSFLEYTIQARPHEPVDYQAQFTFGALTQLFAVLAMNAAALVCRRFPTYAPVAPAMSVMSIYFVLDWAGELRVKMLERQLNWSRLRLLEAGGVAASAAAAILLALGGAGVYALLLPTLATTLPFVYDLFFVMKWRPVWSFDWSEFQPAWRYGWTRIGSGLAARGQQALESGAMAGAIGMAALGVYGRAIGLASFCCLKLTSLLTLTLFPMVTRFEPDSAGMRRAGAMLLRVTAWSAIPTAVLFSLVAGPLVQLLYGSKWADAAPLLPWAFAVLAMTALMEAGAFLLLANREPRKTLALDVVNLAGTGAALVWLLPRGLVTYLAGILLLQAGLFLLALGWLLRSGAIALTGVRAALAIPGVTMALVAGLVKWFGITPWLGTVIGGLVYIAALRVFARRELHELIEFVPGGRWVEQVLRMHGRRVSI